MEEFIRGEIVTIETELQEYTPFSGYALSDPDSAPTVSVIDKKNNVIHDFEVLRQMSHEKTAQIKKKFDSIRSNTEDI